jgi:hypothetical protein
MDSIEFDAKQTGNEKLIIGKDTLFHIHDTEMIQPLENSLKYSGKIYCIFDDRCFSSTLAFYSVCQNVDNLITVGSHTGYFGGQGITPLCFILPHSKLVIRTECTLDATNTNKSNWLSFFHDNMEIPVDLTLKESINRVYYTGKYFDENYLYNIDPVFKKVLKLK